MTENNEYIYGRNSVKSALKAGTQIDRIFVVEDNSDGSIKEIIRLAKSAGIPVKENSKQRLNKMCEGLGYGGKPVNHQGIVAQIPAFEYSDLKAVFKLANEKNQPPFIIILDGIQDPHNLGAVIRSAECFGAHGVIFGKNRSASLTGAAFKVSSGAAAYIPVVKVTNINHTIKELKDKDIWIAAADMDGEEAFKANLTGALALIVGAEGKGVSHLTKELADMVINIPICGRTQSLNASCAAAVLMYEKVRQDLTKN